MVGGGPLGSSPDQGWRNASMPRFFASSIAWPSPFGTASNHPCANEPSQRRLAVAERWGVHPSGWPFSQAVGWEASCRAFRVRLTAETSRWDTFEASRLPRCTLAIHLHFTVPQSKANPQQLTKRRDSLRFVVSISRIAAFGQFRQPPKGNAANGVAGRLAPALRSDRDRWFRAFGLGFTTIQKLWASKSYGYPAAVGIQPRWTPGGSGRGTSGGRFGDDDVRREVGWQFPQLEHPFPEDR